MDSKSQERYQRQIALPEIGAAGQDRLAGSRVLVIGCGALGSTMAELLVRAGVGHLRLVDRDVVSESNLPRQSLYDEADAARRLPKVEAAVRRLHAVNSAARLEPQALCVTARNVEGLLDGAAVVLDGTDNPETRYLLNDACVKHAVPWVYAGVLGTDGTVLPVLPGGGPCLRCVFPTLPAPGTLESCEQAGVLNTTVSVIASLAVTAALQVLLGARQLQPRLTQCQLWRNHFAVLSVVRDPACACCAQRLFPFLDAAAATPPAAAAWRTRSLCGRNCVEVTCDPENAFDLDVMEKALVGVGRTARQAFILACVLPPHTLFFFADGRVLVEGTTDTTAALALVRRTLDGRPCALPGRQ